MTEESGTFDVRKIRKPGNMGTSLTLLIMSVSLVATWATNAQRLNTVEQGQAEGKTERQQIEIHLSTNDQQIAVLKERLQFIVEQLASANQKLDRAEEERRK